MNNVFTPFGLEKRIREGELSGRLLQIWKFVSRRSEVPVDLVAWREHIGSTIVTDRVEVALGV